MVNKFLGVRRKIGENAGIIRLKNLGQKIILWSVLISLLTVNVIANQFLTSSALTQTIPVMKQPFQLPAHLDLARWYWNHGNVAAGRQELLLAQELYNQGQVLGAQNPPSDLIKTWEAQSLLLQKEYQRWENIVKEKQNYGGALIYLTGLAYQLDQTSEAAYYLNQASNLMPNHPLLNAFNELLESTF